MNQLINVSKLTVMRDSSIIIDNLGQGGLDEY